MSTRRVPVATLIAGGLLAAGVAGAGALTATGALAAGSPAPSASASPGTPGSPGVPGVPGEGRRGPGRHGGFGLPGLGLGGPVLHGEAVVPGPGGSGTRTVLVQQGTVSARSGNDLTVRSSDGYTLVWTLTSATTVRTGRNTGSAKDLAVGDTVHVIGTRSGSGGTARLVAERPRGAANGQGNGGFGDGHGRRPGGPTAPGTPGTAPDGTPSAPAPNGSGAVYGTA